MVVCDAIIRMSFGLTGSQVNFDVLKIQKNGHGISMWINHNRRLYC